MATSYALRELASLVGGSVEGDGDRRIHGVAQLDEARAEDLSLLNGLRYRSQFVTTRAGAVIVDPGIAPRSCPPVGRRGDRHDIGDLTGARLGRLRPPRLPLRCRAPRRQGHQ